MDELISTIPKTPARSNGLHPGGRPTDYREEYCQDIVEFFSRPLTKTVIKTYTTKAGTVIEEPVERPEELPTIEEYCNRLGISKQALSEWVKVHPRFGDAYVRAKQLEKDFLVKNGLSGRFDSRFSIFVAQNFTDMRMQPLEIRTTVEHTLGDAEMALLSRQKRMLLGDSQDVIDVDPSK